MIYGVIDIGSNSIRLMLATKNETISKAVKTARLGEGLAFTGVLKEERMLLATNIISEYVSDAQKSGAREIFIFATEAVRVAKNAKDFVDMVYNATHISIDIVPSEIEAKLGFSGAYSGDSSVAVVDIGGASTEITIGDSKGIIYSVSEPIGCVRMRDKCGEDNTLLDQYIDEMVSRYGDLPEVTKAIFVAGTASTVAMMKLKTDVYDVKTLDNLCIDTDEVLELMNVVKSTPLEERYKIVGLEEGRRDILYGGMRLIRAILKKLNLSSFYFSDKDNLEGYLKHLISIGKIE